MEQGPLTPICIDGKTMLHYNGEETLLLNPKEGKYSYSSDELKEVWQYDHPIYYAIDADESAYTNYKSFEDWAKTMHADTRIVLKYVPFSYVKKPFARIDFKNLNLDYEYTICPLADIGEYVGLFKSDVEDLDEEGYKLWERTGCIPEIEITVVMMTDKEFNKWFKKHVKP